LELRIAAERTPVRFAAVFAPMLTKRITPRQSKVPLSELSSQNEQGRSGIARKTEYQIFVLHRDSERPFAA
jgi:hypothetical protein